MNIDTFTHLYVHSDFSMLKSSASIKSLVDAAKSNGMQALALTDFSNMCGWIEFYRKCHKEGIKPIIGCTLKLVNGAIDFTNEDGHNIVCLAENQLGWQNLCRLVSEAHLTGKNHNTPRIDMTLLSKYSEGLIGLSGGKESTIGNMLLADDIEGASITILNFEEIFGKGNFFIQLEDTGTEDGCKIIQRGSKLAISMDCPMVCTGNVHYIDKEDAASHDVLLAIGQKQSIFDTDREKMPSDNFYFKSSEEINRSFITLPSAISNTSAIANRCNVDIDLCTEHYPVYDCGVDDGQSDYLRKICYDAIESRYGWSYEDNMKPTPEQSVIIERVDFELSVISRTGYSSYFLVVWDFINWSRQNSIPVGPGRGSGAGSIVAYLTGITNLDPIKYNLLFERFLNPERVSPPDFDIDFCERRRHEVIDYVRQKYGSDKVAQIGTYGTLKAKAVIKDVTRALGYGHHQADHLNKKLPNNPALTLKAALTPPTGKSNGELFSADFKEIVDSSPWASDVIRHGFKLEGLNRQVGIHAAGVIIGDQPLTNLIPLMEGQNKGDRVTQFAGPPCEDLGLLKMDFLGLRTLTVIDDAVNMIKKNHNIDIDIESIDINDEATFKIFQNGQTEAIFQYESAGMQKWLKKLKPTVFEDLIAMNALYRPGPMEYIPLFINRKHGIESIDYDIPDMEEYLSETYGINVYQEQVMLLSQKLGGFTKGEADTLRKAMGKKKRDVLDELKPKFISQAIDKGHNEEALEKVWKDWEAFAAYAFNKSHSTCYAWIAYQTAYLKAHYPAELLTAAMNSEINNTEKLAFFISAAKSMDIEIVPPSVNISESLFTTDGKSITYGLAAIKGSGISAGNLISSRRQDKLYSSTLDFCERVEPPVNKRTIEALIKSGAFDCFNVPRSATLSALPNLLKASSSTIMDRESGQLNFLDKIECTREDIISSSIPEWHEKEKLDIEREVLGLYITGHPLGVYSEVCEAYSSETLLGVDEEKESRGIKFGATIDEMRILSRKQDGKPWVICKVSDQHDSIDLLCFSDNYSRFAEHFKEGAAVFIEGIYSYDEERGTSKVICENIMPISQAIPRHTAFLEIEIDDLEEEVVDIVVSEINNHRAVFHQADKDALINFMTDMIRRDKGNLERSCRYLRDMLSPISSGQELITLFKGNTFGNINSTQVFQKHHLRSAIDYIKEHKSSCRVILGEWSASGSINNRIELGTAPDKELIDKIGDLIGSERIKLTANKKVPSPRQSFKK